METYEQGVKLLPRLVHKYPKQLREDLMQVGHLVFWEHRNDEFQHVKNLVMKALGEYADQQTPVPVPNAKRMLLRKAVARLWQKLQHDPTPVDLAKELGWTQKRVLAIMQTDAVPLDPLDRRLPSTEGELNEGQKEYIISAGGQLLLDYAEGMTITELQAKHHIRRQDIGRQIREGATRLRDTYREPR